MSCADGLLSKKLTIQFNLDIGCNANCFMCDKRVRDKKSKNTYLNLIKLLRFLDPIIVDRIKLLGGEPLLDKKGLLLFIKTCHLKGFDCFFPSNGSLITRSYFDALVQTGLKELTISLDSFIPEEHDSIRGLKGMHKRIVNILIYIKKEYPKFRLSLNFLVLPQNIKSLKRTILFAETLKINEFNVLYPEDFGKNFERIKLSSSTKLEIESIRSTCLSSQMSINWNINNIKNNNNRCCQTNKITIFEDGKINFCEKYPFKKIYKLNQPLTKILNEPEIKTFLNTHALSHT